jgi:hypothetical protein
VDLKLLVSPSKVTIAEFNVVIFVSNLSQQIDTMQLMKNLQSHPIALNSGLGIRCPQVCLGHSDYLQFLVCDDLVAD